MGLRLFLTAFATGVCLVLFVLITATTLFSSESPRFSRRLPAVASVEPSPTPGEDTDASQPQLTSGQPPQSQEPAATAEPAPTEAPPPEPTPTPEPPAQPAAPGEAVPPGGLTASYVAGQGVILSWSPVAGAGYYNVYRSNVPGGGAGATYTALGSSGSPGTVDPAVVSGQTYYYVVTASSGGIESRSSNEAAIQVP